MPTSSYVVAEEKPSRLTGLIVDKNGILGEHITQKFPEDQTLVVVSTIKEIHRENTILIPYTKTIPEIPEGNYTHMFFVWDGRAEALHLLEPLLKKAFLDKAQFVFICDYRFYNEKLIRFVHQEYSKAAIIFTGDIFGNSMCASVVTKFFQEAKEKGAIALENVGLRHIYPVEFSDMTSEIVKVGLGGGGGKVYLAFQQHGMTELSLVHAIQKVDPLIRIDFKKEEREQFPFPQGEYLFDSHYDAVRKIQHAYTEFVATKKGQGTASVQFSPLTHFQEKQKQLHKKRRWIGVAIVLFVFLASPVILTILYASLGGLVLYAASNSLKAGNYQKALLFSQSGRGIFLTAQTVEVYADIELQTVFLGSSAQALSRGIERGESVASLLSDATTLLESYSRVAKGTSSVPSSDFLIAARALKHMFLTISSLHIGSVAGISVDALAKETQPIGSIVDIAPTLMGFPDKKTYLVLFQNNMELRPGGGFIGSYAIVTVDKGRMVDIKIHNVYDADGQLKGHVEPPYVIRRYIPLVHWYLRDSNFDVDFSQDAANAAFFLSQETGEKVDGVIGIDLTVVKAFLSLTGPVYVPQYNETVASENVFQLTEAHAEKNSFAGSTQKQDFLGALFQAVQKRLTTGRVQSPGAIVGLLGTLKSKDIVFGFSDPLVQDVFTVNGLSGTLWDGRRLGSGILNDFTGINEANIGVNKANYFITRKVVQHMAINDKGDVSGKLTVTYINGSPANTWPGGDYKNYLRFLLPSGATIQSIQIDGVTQTVIPAVTDFHAYEAAGFVTPKGLEVDSNTESGKQLFGFVTTVKAGSAQKVVVSYVLPKVDVSSPVITYNGWLFKQPGVDVYPYEFILSVPNNFFLSQKPDWIEGQGNTIAFKKSFGEDTQFSVVFSQK